VGCYRGVFIRNLLQYSAKSEQPANAMLSLSLLATLLYGDASRVCVARSQADTCAPTAYRHQRPAWAYGLAVTVHVQPWDSPLAPHLCGEFSVPSIPLGGLSSTCRNLPSLPSLSPR